VKTPGTGYPEKMNIHINTHIKMQEGERISATYTHLRKTEDIEAVWNGQGI
jgi:hypothetical protein